MKHRPLKQGDIFPSHVLRDEYGMDAANRPTITVDPDQVPEILRPLIPLVERWAISCDVTRHDYFEHQSEADIAAFWHELNTHVQAIHDWLDSLGKEYESWPRAADHFVSLLKAHSEAYQPTEEEVLKRERRFNEAQRKRALKQAIDSGLAAFQNKDYEAAIAVLSPYEDQLERLVAMKLAYARKQIQA